MTTLIAFDSETERIGPGNIAPPMICASFASRDVDGELDLMLLGNHPDDELEAMLEWMLTDENVRVVTQNGGFDYAVICRTFPRLIPLVYAFLIAGRGTDTMWREKLLNLSTSGRLEKMEMPDGSKVRISYAMEALADAYLGIDMSADKGDTEESWRANYSTLDGMRAVDYPDDASEYALNDAAYTLRIHEGQEQRKDEWSMASTETEEFQLTKSFVLQLMSAWGMEVDPEATDVMEAATIKVMEENKDLLEGAGILRAAGRYGPPYKKHLERAEELVREEFGAEAYLAIDDHSWGDYAEWLEEQGIKFTKAKGKDGSINEAVFQEFLAALYKQLGEIPTMTDGGEKKAPAIKCDAEVHSYLATKDPVMEQYHERKSLAKIVTQMIPALRSGPVVYPSYNAIVETGRTSSFDGGWPGKKKGEPRNYASVNIQQVPNLIKGLDPRRCFRPREGRVFFDVDFTGLELACVGHVTYGLFGESVHRDLYNAGIDLHGYLGTQLALGSPAESHPMTLDFQAACREEGILSDPMACYDAFFLLKSHADEDVRGFFKHFRTFAKPVGLGFPGGLGPATLVEFARKTYGVILTEHQAEMFRDFWRATYPEMPLFFDWVNAQTDEYNSSNEFWYESDMGMIRRGATFCAEANGRVMQTPGAEAAMSGTILLSQACYDPTQESVLYGCRPIAFVHDQNIGETTRDESLWSAQCEEAARLMREGAELVLTSMKMRTDEALLTEVWTKSAEPVRNDKGQHLVWRQN